MVVAHSAAGWFLPLVATRRRIGHGRGKIRELKLWPTNSGYPSGPSELGAFDNTYRQSSAGDFLYYGNDSLVVIAVNKKEHWIITLTWD